MYKLKRVGDISKRKNGYDKITTKNLSGNKLMYIEYKKDEKRANRSIFRRLNRKNELRMKNYSSKRSYD
jgi:hypothetical protein